jgi:hypothetical protein
MTPARFRWGLMLVSIGVALLLTNADVLDYSYWTELLSLWPIILIAIGLEKIFLHGKLRFISYLAPLILVGTMIYVGINAENYSSDGVLSPSRWSEEADASIKTIEAQIDHYRTDISIGLSQADLIKTRFDRFSRKPDIDFSKSGGLGKLEINHRTGGIRNIIIINNRRFRNDWQVFFTDQASLKLTCRGEESEVDLNLRSIPLEELTVENDDGDIFLEIGSMLPNVFAEISGDEASFSLNAPRNCGLKVKVSGNNLNNYLESHNLVKNGEFFVSENFDSAAVKLNLKLDDNLQSVSVSFY